jgi:hypothetical protein
MTHERVQDCNHFLFWEEKNGGGVIEKKRRMIPEFLDTLRFVVVMVDLENDSVGPCQHPGLLYAREWRAGMVDA